MKRDPREVADEGLDFLFSSGLFMSPSIWLQFQWTDRPVSLSMPREGLIQWIEITSAERFDAGDFRITVDLGFYVPRVDEILLGASKPQPVRLEDLHWSVPLCRDLVRPVRRWWSVATPEQTNNSYDDLSECMERAAASLLEPVERPVDLVPLMARGSNADEYGPAQLRRLVTFAALCAFACPGRDYDTAMQRLQHIAAGAADSQTSQWLKDSIARIEQARAAPGQHDSR